MPRTRKGGRKRKRRHSIIPKPVAKGIRDINKITSKVARGIDKYPLAALRKTAKVVLKPRKMPRLKIGGFLSKAVRQLRNPGVYKVVKTAKKGGRKYRRGGTNGKKKKRPWGLSDVVLGAVAAPVEVGRLALGKGGRKTRRGGRKTRRGGRKTRRGGRKARRGGRKARR